MRAWAPPEQVQVPDVPAVAGADADDPRLVFSAPCLSKPVALRTMALHAVDHGRSTPRTPPKEDDDR
jgi:hypothetical protein